MNFIAQRLDVPEKVYNFVMKMWTLKQIFVFYNNRVFHTSALIGSYFVLSTVCKHFWYVFAAAWKSSAAFNKTSVEKTS